MKNIFLNIQVKTWKTFAHEALPKAFPKTRWHQSFDIANFSSYSPLFSPKEFSNY